MGAVREAVRRAGLACALAAALVLGTVPPVRAQGMVATEYAVKAAFLYHFAKFTEWPARVGGPNPDVVQICVLGEDPFGWALDRMSERGADGLQVEVRHVSRADERPHCHILFISRSEQRQVGRILRDTVGRGVLSVSDMDGFIDAGGVIQFVVEHDKVRFLISRAAAARADVRLSSRLLAVAHVVDGPEGGEP